MVYLGVTIGVGQTHSTGIMQSSPTNYQMEWKLRKDKQDRKGESTNGDEKKTRCYLMT